MANISETTERPEVDQPITDSNEKSEGAFDNWNESDDSNQKRRQAPSDGQVEEIIPDVSSPISPSP